MVRGEGFPVDLLYYALEDHPFSDFDRETFLSTQGYNQEKSYDPVTPEAWTETLHAPLEQQESEDTAKTTRKKESRKKGRPCNPVPRHKRFPHRAFFELEKLVPEINDHPVCQDSKSAKLFKVSDHCRRLAGESRQRDEEIASLRQQIERMSSEIQERQSCLPAVGIQQVDKPPCFLDTMLDNYVRSRIYHNWKFWMFSLLVRQLFASYNTSVSTINHCQFTQSVCQWTETYLNAHYLRPAVGSLLQDVRTQTPILTEPYRVAQSVITNFFQTSTHV
ncbi:carbohydrate-responsive element-binding protein-like [Liolophura sinensis]|uniref:carbohydrate-responsive element-binding protein-like n=1 Tax=Liolophura sinensis TaxID=3198878 RepID=UPI0031586075